MNIRTFKGVSPDIAENAFIDETAVVIGSATLGEHVSVWPMTVIRADVNSISIGDYTNIQDGSVLHVNHSRPANPGGDPLVIGAYVTVGHKVMLHACTIGNFCLIGMDAMIMDKVMIEDYVIVGAGSLVPPNKVLDSGLWVGRPAIKKRELTKEEIDFLKYSATHYAVLADEHKSGL